MKFDVSTTLLGVTTVVHKHTEAPELLLTPQTPPNTGVACMCRLCEPASGVIVS